VLVDVEPSSAGVRTSDSSILDAERLQDLSLDEMADAALGLTGMVTPPDD
jgi:hypothetical protein